MTEEDIDAVAELEKKTFSQPWSREGLKHYLEAGLTLFIVAKEQQTLAGYAAVMCILDEANLVSIIVDEPYRQTGIASELLSILYDELVQNEVTSMNLEVRESNTAAIGLYEKEGFLQVGRRKGFYEKPKEDALLYIKQLGNEVENG